MNFTPKIDKRPVVRGILTIVAAVGLIGWLGRVVPSPRESFETSVNVPAAALSTAPAMQTARPEYYQPVTAWYKNKQWWKRNAPIVGGAAGGALVGGLVGGGKGVIIGGAAGGGGGYLYKRHHHNHNSYHNSYSGHHHK
jgi:hypothetical protein